MSILDRLGLLEDVLATGSPPLGRQFVYSEENPEGLEQPPQNPGDIGFGLSVRRDTLDPMLLEHARNTGAEVRMGCWIKEVERAGDRVVGVAGTSATGELNEGAQLVVGADGVHSFVAKALAAEYEEYAPPARGIYYCYVKGWASQEGGPPDAAEFSHIPGELAYVFPSNGGQTCIALSLDQEDCKWLKRSATARFQERLQRHSGLMPRFTACTAVSRVLGHSPEPSYVRVPRGPGWALVGDASIHSDPFAGQGMDMAGVHATFLGEEVNSWLSGKCSQEDALEAYHHRRNDDALDTYRQVVAEALQI